MRRRRRRDYTPEQKKAAKILNAAELTVRILAIGLGKSLESAGHYACPDQVGELISRVTGDLGPAVIVLRRALEAHDNVFARAKHRVNPAPKKKAAKK